MCLYLALYSAGAGHGTYGFAIFCFPWTMLSLPLFSEIPTAFLALAMVQILLYGVILDLAGK